LPVVTEPAALIDCVEMLPPDIFPLTVNVFNVPNPVILACVPDVKLPDKFVALTLPAVILPLALILPLLLIFPETAKTFEAELKVNPALAPNKLLSL
jgi:hypothetical protein